jgi:hypothetical protein
MDTLPYTFDQPVSVLLEHIQTPLTQWTRVHARSLQYACMNCGGSDMRTVAMNIYPQFLAYIQTHELLPCYYLSLPNPHYDRETKIYAWFQTYSPPEFTTPVDAYVAYQNALPQNPSQCSWCEPVKQT